MTAVSPTPWPILLLVLPLLQWAIEHADQQQAVIEEQLDTAIQTGGVHFSNCKLQCIGG